MPRNVVAARLAALLAKATPDEVESISAHVAALVALPTKRRAAILALTEADADD